MKIIEFIDLENFKKSISKIHKDRIIDYPRLASFIFDYTVKSHNWEKYNPRLIRAYAYTGEYTEEILKKISSYVQSSTNPNKIKIHNIILETARRHYSGQKKFKEIIRYCKFLELKTKPLHYDGDKIFQKGVDVQLAVDLVAHAYMKNYDVAVICSGDVDLLESLRISKHLGKKVILVSHPEITSSNMIEVADSFLDISKLDNMTLDTFSHIFMPKTNNPQ